MKTGKVTDTLIQKATPEVRKDIEERICDYCYTQTPPVESPVRSPCDRCGKDLCGRHQINYGPIRNWSEYGQNWNPTGEISTKTDGGLTCKPCLLTMIEEAFPY